MVGGMVWALSQNKSLKEVIIDDGPTPHQVFWWCNNKNSWAVRKGDWKLLKNPNDPTHKAPITREDSLFLVNIADYPDELKNLAGAYPEKVKELSMEFDNWYEGKEQ